MGVIDAPQWLLPAFTRSVKALGAEDETASAAFAEADLYHLGVPMETVKRVCSLIVNLKRHMLDEHDIDAQALIDADLGTLAVDPQTYAEYVRLLREEYSHIPMEKYLRGRLTIVSRLLNREHLFHSPLGERWEHAARENLSAEQRRLKEKLTKLITEQSGQDAQGAQDVAKPFVAQATARSFPAATSAEPAATGNGSALEQPDGGVGSDPRTPPLGLQSLTPSGQPAPGSSRDGDTLRIDTAELRALRSMASPTTPAAAVSPASSLSPASPLSATSPRTPARGVPAVSSASARRPAEASTEHGEPREDKDGEGPMSHTASMESCVADLDLLMCSRNRTDEAGERRARVQAERDKLAEKLRAKTQEAKELREARTGEIAPITEEIIDDGAGDL